MKNTLLNLNKRWLQLIFLFLLTSIGSCKKETPIKDSLIVKRVLSSNSPDYASRLNAIKNAFYVKKLNEKLKVKVDENLTWEPDWGSPKSQIVNDSVSYVFYPLVGYLSKNGKREAARTQGAKFYLIIKNEKEFYKGLYYRSNSGTKSKEELEKEIELHNFTGNLLLTNLEGKEAFLLHYNNGIVNKDELRTTTSYQKLMSVDRTTSYYETQCHTEINSCTYYTYLPSCGGSMVVEFSFYCQEPSYCQNSIWILSDHNVDQVCEDVWFPDPPTDPGNGGGGGSGEGYGAEGTDGEVPYQYLMEQDLVDAVIVGDGKNPIDSKKYIDCFTDGKQAQSYKMTIYIDQPMPGTNAQFYSTLIASNGLGLTINSNGSFFDVGHAFIGFEKLNTDGTMVRQFMGFYPGGNSFKSDGVIKDDSGHIYNVSYTKEVTQAQFGLALSAVRNDDIGTKYVLADYFVGDAEYNCTDAAIKWMTSAGIQIPFDSPRGIFVNSPGDYGQKLGKINGANKIGDTAAPIGKGPCN